MINFINVYICYTDASGRKKRFVQPIDVRNRDVSSDFGVFVDLESVTHSRRSYVRVKFDGNPTPYTYRIDPDEADTLEIGDRVAVDSPLTNRVEYPRIKEFPRQVRQAKKWARKLPSAQARGHQVHDDLTDVLIGAVGVQSDDEEDRWDEFVIQPWAVLRFQNGTEIHNPTHRPLRVKFPKGLMPR